MTTAKHTPGPWQAGFTGTEVVALVGGQRFIVAQPYTRAVDGHVLSHEQQEANANLIAAAPDLLKALQMCIGWMGDRRDVSPESIEAWVKGRYAIAKALTGESK